MMVLAASDMQGAKVNKTKVKHAGCEHIHTYIFPSGVVHISDTEVTRERTVVVRQCIGTTPSAGL